VQDLSSKFVAAVGSVRLVCSMSSVPERSVAEILVESSFEFLRFLQALVVSFLVLYWSSMWFGHWKEQVDSRTASTPNSNNNNNNNKKRKRSVMPMFHVEGPQRQRRNHLRRSTSLPRRLDHSLLSQPPSKRNTLAPRLRLRTRSVDVLTRFPEHGLLNPMEVVFTPLDRARHHHRSRLILDLLYAASNMDLAMAAPLRDNNNVNNDNNNNNNNNHMVRPLGFYDNQFAPRLPPARAHRWRRGAGDLGPAVRRLDRWGGPPDAVRMQLLMAREQSFLAPPTLVHRDPAPCTALQQALKSVHANDPSCTAFTTPAQSDDEAQLLAQALKHNNSLSCLHLYPSGWKDLGNVKSIANSIRHHPVLVEIHLFQNSDCGLHNFVSQLAFDILIQAMHMNPSIQFWGLKFVSSKGSLKDTVTDTLCKSIATCDHLKKLEIVDEHSWQSWSLSQGQCRTMFCNTLGSPHSATEPHRKLATAMASASLKELHLVKVDHSYLENLFREFARVGGSSIQTLHIESTSHAGTAGLELFLALPSCPLRTLRLQSIQTFQRSHMDQLVRGLMGNTSVKNIAFTDCGFHPEVVRPLQDLVRTRLDLESFQITRCNADPTMAILTCFQNNHSQVKSVTMGYSLGIEDRLGGDAIRSVLRYNSTLQTLNLTGSHRLGPVGLRHLARGLGKNGTLRKLDLSHCSVPHSSLALMIQHITGNPATKLSSINLSHNSLNQTGVQMLVDEWLLHPHCKLQELILNRCEIVAGAFLILIRAIANHTTSLQVLELQECGRVCVNGLQEIAESLFRLGNLRVFKASCFKSAVHTIHPMTAHAGAPPLGVNHADNDAYLPIDDDDSDDDDESDMEDDPIMAAAIAEEVANRNMNGGANNNTGSHCPIMSGPLRLLRETFLAGLIHNDRLEHISFVNLLECVLKPKDASRVQAWMDFCGRRNVLQPLLQQTNIPLLQILTDIVRECRDPRTCTLNATGLSLNYHCLRNRPDALDRVQRMLNVDVDEKASGHEGVSNVG
jgi:Leucine Rich repeat